jgi:phosphoribosyl 1,2-cyclic phosphodiesterase
MRVSVLASGSNGNATCIKTTNESFLIDDGLSFKMLYARMEETNNDIHNLSSIFITHEHIDHVSGLKVLLKRKQLNCYLTRGTYEGLNSETKAIVAENNVIFIQSGDEILIDDCKITVIATHHDAKEPVGYVIEQLDKKVVYITDTGYVDQKYFPLLKDANLYVMESNYDVELLWSSSRPFDLKKRIDGDYGHMSNIASAVLLAKLYGPNTKQVVFAHISDDCNYYHIPKLIINEHKKVYEEVGINCEEIEFIFASRNGVTGVYEI